MFREKQRDITITKDELIDFETKVSDTWEAGMIKAPVHLSYGNEDFLINLFQYVHPDDWVLTTWRSHYHALLHGVPKDELWSKILAGRSISFQSPQYKVYTSAIVGGILPIGVGIAKALQWHGAKRMVWVFVGDMCLESGTFYEALKYSMRNELPIHFVAEDNGLSTNSPTQKTWGEKSPFGFMSLWRSNNQIQKMVTYNQYKRERYPHVGIGKFIHF